MSEATRLLLADLGGTHIRFAIAYDGVVEHIRKYRVSDFSDPVQATERYLSDVQRGMYQFDAYLMSSAAIQAEAGVWTFSNQNPWRMKERHFMDQLPINHFEIIDDFVSNAYGVLDLDFDKLHTIRPGGWGEDDTHYAGVVAGCGTGLGLAYLLPDAKGYKVHETWGGHMAPVALTAEQREVIDAVQTIKSLPSSPIFEDVVSGPGLTRIYHALQGTQPGRDPYAEGKELLYQLSRGHDVAQCALRLFHEFLGLYMHQAAVFMHAYKGVYLTGGMIDAIFREDLFMPDVLLSYFQMQPVPVVAETLTNTPLYWVKDEFIALQGLVTFWDRRNTT